MGRPKGSKNKPKIPPADGNVPPVKRGPGRPKGSKNKPKYLADTGAAIPSELDPSTVLQDKKRGRRSNAELQMIAAAKSGQKIHPVKIFTQWLVENMDATNRAYWLSEARRRDVSINAIVERYLLGDFGISSENFTYSS